MTVKNSTDIYSNAFNFHDFMVGGVDPRTGIYTCSLTLGEIKSGSLNGPSLPINLYFNPINGADIGLGVGWSLALTRYDKENETLTLSSGESYKAKETIAGLSFEELKLETIKTSRPAPNRYDLVHKNGQREELKVYGASEVAVPTRIVAANGASITFDYTSINEQPILKEVRDTQRILLSVSRSQGRVTLVQYPGTECEAKFILTLANDRVVSIDLPTGGSWKLEYEDYDRLSYLTAIDSPLGAREVIGYQGIGHRLPRGSPLRSLPYVNSHTVFPRHNQPAITKNYEFSDNNFLGFGAEDIRWSTEGDNLYQTTSDYEYTSTESLTSEGKVYSSTTRTYNQYHLRVSEVTTCNKMVTSQLIEYHLDPRKSFAQQPAQFRLPKVQTQRYENRATGKFREEVTRTEYDTLGNLLKQVDPNGVTTVSEFYPATGADGCPADPLGFVRFEKQRTVFPATGLAAAATTVTRYSYQLQPGLTGATVQNVVPVREQFFEQTGSREALRSQTDLVYFSAQADPLRHGLLQKQTVTQNGESTQSEFLYTFSDTDRTLQTILTGRDGTRTTAARTYSVLNGVKLSEQNEDEGIVVFEYDTIGRVVSETVAPGTPFEARRRTSYQLAVGSSTPATMLSTDVSGLQQRITYDGLGRTVRIEEQDADNQANGPLRTVYSAQHNAVGQLIESIRTDWLRGAPLVLKTGFVFDDWGQVKTTRHADGRKEHRELDPVTRSETSWLEGMGKKVTIHNDFGKPDSVEVFDIRDNSQGKTLHMYDGLGRAVSQTDPVGNETTYEYDVFNRLHRSVLPDGNAVQTQYAAHSQALLPIEIKVAGRSLGQQVFDGLGRLTKSTVGGRTTTSGYDAGFSLPAWSQMPNTDKVEYTYERNLGKRVTLRKATGKTGESVASFTYDPQSGLPVRHIEQGYETRYEYYPSGRLKKETSTRGTAQKNALYAYSLAGRPLTCTDVFGNEHKTEYDEWGRPKSFEHDALKTTFSYNTLNQLTAVNAQEKSGQASLITRLAYDDLGREVSRVFEINGSPTQVLTSSYTQANKLAQKTLKSGDVVLRNELFSYDKRGRLSLYTCGGTQLPRDACGKEILKQTYVFDAMDNILTLKTGFPGGENLASYQYSANDPTQLIGITHTHKDYPAPVVLQYDANGRLIKDDQERTLTYDALGRLTQVASAVKAVVRGYHYDSQDQLVELSQPEGAPIQRFYRDERVINEVRGDDKSTCLRQAAILLGQHQQGLEAGTKLYSTDQQQSVLCKLKGAQYQDVAYSPYGYRPVEGGLFSLLGFSGEQLDPVTGLYLLGNGYRAYSPTLMRFFSPDSLSPFGEGGLNPYAYCAGDPINRFDPTGHSFWSIFTSIVLTLIGVALSVATLGAATPLGVLSIGLGLASAVAGIAEVIVNEVAPGSEAASILGWVSLGLGVASLGVGAAGAVGGASKLASRGATFGKVFSAIIGPGERVAALSIGIGSVGKLLDSGSGGESGGATKSDEPVRAPSETSKDQNTGKQSNAGRSGSDTWNNAASAERGRDRVGARLAGKDRMAFDVHPQTSAIGVRRLS